MLINRSANRALLAALGQVVRRQLSDSVDQAFWLNPVLAFGTRFY